MNLCRGFWYGVGPRRSAGTHRQGKPIVLNSKKSGAVIAGETSGIGLARMRCWAANGDRPVIGGIARKQLWEAARAIGGEVANVVCNAMREEDNARLAGDTFFILGGLRRGSEG